MTWHWPATLGETALFTLGALGGTALFWFVLRPLNRRLDKWIGRLLGVHE